MVNPLHCYCLCWNEDFKHCRFKKFLIALWALQITLNTIWTPIFFGLNDIKLAMKFMVGLWLSVLLMVITYWFSDPLSSILIFPYFIWVSFATAKFSNNAIK